jgi:hypothetical protein
VGQAGTPPHPIERRTRPIAVSTPVVVAGAEPADEGTVLFVQVATAPIAGRAAEPRALALLTPEGPLLLELDDLALAVAGDSDLGPAQPTSAQH